MNQVRQKKNKLHRAVARELDALAADNTLTELLDRVPEDRCRTLLFLRHQLGLSWPAIRQCAPRYGLYYSERQLYRLYARALAELTPWPEAEG